MGKKSEKSNKNEKQANADKIEKRNRGQKLGKPGKGCGKHYRLEVIEILKEERYCPICVWPGGCRSLLSQGTALALELLAALGCSGLG